MGFHGELVEGLLSCFFGGGMFKSRGSSLVHWELICGSLGVNVWFVGS